MLDCALVIGFGKLGQVRVSRSFIPQALLTLLLALGLIQLTWMIGTTLYRHVDAAQASAIELRKIEGLKLEVKMLADRAKQARVDAMYLERLARKQGFVVRGEKVIVPRVR